MIIKTTDIECSLSTMSRKIKYCGKYNIIDLNIFLKQRSFDVLFSPTSSHFLSPSLHLMKNSSGANYSTDNITILIGIIFNISVESINHEMQIKWHWKKNHFDVVKPPKLIKNYAQKNVLKKEFRYGETFSVEFFNKKLFKSFGTILDGR